MQPIHPFPARMAADLALETLARLPAKSSVLDPMAGSGTVLRAAAARGHRALGFDLDPLAVLMARVWTTPLASEALPQAAEALVAEAAALSDDEVVLPAIDTDPETQQFIAYWFASPQCQALRRLSYALSRRPAGSMTDALKVALSRIIITKDHGASLARDVSHSRPHRAFTTNAFPVLPAFVRAATELSRRLTREPPPGQVCVALGDARDLSTIPTGAMDAVLTSPPYLNAIDYLRGHRLALVWLGYRLADLRATRAISIGAERRPDPGGDEALARALTASLAHLDRLPPAQRRMVDRYVLDLHAMLAEIQRVLRPGGTAILVVGNSCLRGVFVKNATALVTAAAHLGFELRDEVERALPANRRYLPPPEAREPSHLEKRMRTETILTFSRP